MITEKELLDTIFDRLAEDGPRLVYADWLEEEGESERAEIIRVQTAILRDGMYENGKWRSLADSERVKMQVRSRELENLHLDKWFTGHPNLRELLRQNPVRIIWDRGFIRYLKLYHIYHDLTFHLPDNLCVIDVIDLYNTPIRTLPQGLRVGGLLRLTYTNIHTLPDNLHCGSIDLSQTQFSTLPAGFRVVRDLHLEHTPTARLPKKLSVGGSLYLSHTPIRTLPDDLRIDRNLYLSGTQITARAARNILENMPFLSDQARTTGLRSAGFASLARQAERRAAQRRIEGRT